MLAGLLIGFNGQQARNITNGLHRKLESGIVTAVNTALSNGEIKHEFPANSIAVVLSHVLDLLNDHEKSKLQHDLLLPCLMHAAFYSQEGLHMGYFLSTIDADVIQHGPSQFGWSSLSSTFVRLERWSGGPMMSSLGALSRLIATSVQHVQRKDHIATMLEGLSAFTRSLCLQWRHNKLSEIDVTEEQTFLDNDTLRTTSPFLWRTLRSALFAVVILLRSVLERVLIDRRLASSEAARTAARILNMLRDLHFISSRMGANSFAQYTFVNLTAVDLLSSQHPTDSERLLQEIRPSQPGVIPQHPLNRCFDLYFLNTAEHFAIVLSPQANEELLVGAATPYLGLGGDPRLLEIFEAAHSTMLAVLSAPQNADLLMRHIHPYISALFNVFPQNLSSRQYRLAIRKLVQITSPPAPIAQTQPSLPSTILELVRHKLESASPAPLPNMNVQTNAAVQEEPVSEQSVLALTLIDALPFLPLDQLEDWLPLAAESLNFVSDPIQLQACRRRFWEVLSNGEMDVAHASLCLTWWGTRGGSNMVMNGASLEEEGPFMSGALVENGRL